MPIYKGATPITSLFLGSTAIARIYHGSELVFGSGGGTPSNGDDAYIYNDPLTYEGSGYAVDPDLTIEGIPLSNEGASRMIFLVVNANNSNVTRIGEVIMTVDGTSYSMWPYGIFGGSSGSFSQAIYCFPLPNGTSADFTLYPIDYAGGERFYIVHAGVWTTEGPGLGYQWIRGGTVSPSTYNGIAAGEKLASVEMEMVSPTHPTEFVGMTTRYLESHQSTTTTMVSGDYDADEDGAGDITYGSHIYGMRTTVKLGNRAKYDRGCHSPVATGGYRVLNGVDIGHAEAGRLVIVCVYGRWATLNGVEYNDGSGWQPMVTAAIGEQTHYVGIFSAIIPSGATADFRFDNGGVEELAVTVLTKYGALSATPVGAGTRDATSSTLMGPFDIQEGAFVVYMRGTGGLNTWPSDLGGLNILRAGGCHWPSQPRDNTVTPRGQFSVLYGDNQPAGSDVYYNPTFPGSGYASCAVWDIAT